MLRLAYGTRLVVDAREVEGERLRGDRVAEATRSLAASWPLGGGVRDLAVREDGSSLAAWGSQGHLVVHAFPKTGCLTVVAFTVGEAPVAAFVEQVERLFELSVYDLVRSRYDALLPADGRALERAVLGDRFVARARLVPSVG